MSEITSMLKDKAECQGDQARCSVDGCPKYGTLGRPAKDGSRRVKGCADPIARGKRNRKQGLAKQSKARDRLSIVGGSDEEKWASLFANEVKSGKQCGPVVTAWNRAHAQIVSNEPDYGNRRKHPRVVWMPDGWGKRGLVTVTTDTWAEIVAPALLHFYGEA